MQRVSDLARALAPAPSSPALVESRPADRATGVALSVQIALRFSEPIAVTSVSETTVRLAGLGGAVAVVPVPVEAGLLLFVTPQTLLAPGAFYTLTLDGLRSTAGVPMPATTVSFTTAGIPAPGPGGDGGRDVTDPDEDGSRLVRDERTGRLVSKWQDLPLLEAPPGVTALAGQVLQLNGDPLPGVTLEVDGRHTRSDRTGRFLLADLPDAGVRVLVIDGRSAHRRGATYGVFEVSFDIAAGQTTPLGYAIWMPKIDWANAVRIPSPTTTETVISTPRLPGLELRLPPNTVVRDRDGKVVTEISLTPVPTERPPFPLPDGVNFPIYLTTQPGGARLETSTGGTSPGAPVVYPNYFGYPPGTEADFWKYEPENGRRWYRYGKGTVDGSGQYFEPSEYMRVRKFTMFTQVAPNLNGTTPAGSAPPPSSASPPGGNSFGSDPVDLSTGLFVMTKTDLALADVLPIALTRTYRQNDSASRAFGIGANHPYNLLLYSENGYLTISLILPDGGRIRYQTINGTITDFVYDGLNPVRETIGASTVDLLTGLGIDEYFTRTDSSSSRDLLSDALGSTVSLADSAGSIQTEYSYEPFGASTATGSASANELRYTGREDDGTSGYYYQARYYHPGLQRFISEDPIEFEAGDIGLYNYVFNSPINWIDPNGLSGIESGGGMGAASGAGAGGGSAAGGGPGPGSAACRGRYCQALWLQCYSWENVGEALGIGGALAGGAQIINKTAIKPRGGVAGGGPSGRYTSWTRRLETPGGRAIGRVSVGSATIIGAGVGAWTLHGICFGNYMSCLRSN
jgi:RHS repeat-associated protein